MTIRISSIHSKQLVGIVAVQGATTLAWVIYALYLPDLLARLGFAPTLAQTLLVIEHLLEALIQPIFGGLSDRSQRHLGNRFPWIVLGTILAAVLFLALPAIAVTASPTSAMRWAFPVFAVLWASAMAIFRSPVMVLLGQAASQRSLPQAASFLTLIQQLVNALRFTAYGVIVALGPLVTFATGSFVLLGALATLRWVTPVTAPAGQLQLRSPKLLPKTYAIILGTAVFTGWGLRYLFATVSQSLAVRFGETAVSTGMLGFSLVLALTALPAGLIASKLGNARTMLAGAIATAVLLGGIIPATSSPTPFWIGGAIAMGFSFSTVLNGMVPFVLGLVPEARAGLGLGLYFGAFSGAISFFELLSQHLTWAGPGTFGSVSFLMAGLFVALSFLGIGNQH